jgi:L-ascorbate metabolism protein UlaG (beta-lactamase superfamily)
MKTHSFRFLAALGSLWACAGGFPWLHAQPEPQFTVIQSLTNKETRLLLSAPTGRSYRIEVATNALNWQALVTFPTNAATSLQHTDSAAPYLPTRFYRAAQLAGTNIASGDHLATTNGDVVIRPVDHAGFVMQWNGLWIYNDPASGSFAGIPKADLVLISHTHGDHFQTSYLTSVGKSNTVFVAPQAVYSGMLSGQRSNTVVLPNGASTNVLGIDIEAVPAYNANHPLGAGNGYVLTIGGKRLYIAGDTGNTAEMRALPNIDVAFLCINQPFTMTVNDATNAVRAFRPKIVYPYHYRDQSGATTNAAAFKHRLGTDLGIEVRLRKWY